MSAFAINLAIRAAVLLSSGAMSLPRLTEYPAKPSIAKMNMDSFSAPSPRLMPR